MTEQTTLFLGPEENVSILKKIFSGGKTSAEDIAKTSGKTRGTIHNAIHDLKILKLLDEQLIPLNETKSIVYGRDVKKILGDRFISIEGYTEAIEEVNSIGELTPINVGKIFCFHTNARSSKESSIKQIGRLYLRWLRFLDLIKDKEVKENG